MNPGIEFSHELSQRQMCHPKSNEKTKEQIKPEMKFQKVTPRIQNQGEGDMSSLLILPVLEPRAKPGAEMQHEGTT